MSDPVKPDLTLEETAQQIIDWLVGTFTTRPAEPSSFTVRHNGTRLEYFLSAGRVQKWRQGVYCRHGVVRVTRNGRPVPHLTPSLALKAGDNVVVDAPSADAEREMQRIADTTAVDYAYVFPDDDYTKGIEALLKRRPATRVVSGLNGLKAFTELLTATPREGLPYSVDAPIRSVLIASHAQDYGFMWEGIAARRAHTRQEDVVKAADATATNAAPLAVPTRFFEPRPRVNGVALPFDVVLLSCNVGRSTPFLNNFRRAKNADRAMAPVHFFAVSNRLAYVYRTLRVVALQRLTRPELLRRFARLIDPSAPAAQETLVDGLLPPDSSLHGDAPKRDIPQPHYPPRTFALPIGATNVGASASFRYVHRALIRQKSTRIPFLDDGNDARRKIRAMQEVVAKDDRYRNGPEPHLCWGEASEQAFVDSWNWEFKPAGGNKVTCDAMRHEITATP